MADDMLNVVKYDAGGVEIKLDPATVKNYLVRGNGKVTDQEVLFFIRTCQAQKLNPLVYGEVYLIKFGDEAGTAGNRERNVHEESVQKSQLQRDEVRNRCSKRGRDCPEGRNVPVSDGRIDWRMVQGISRIERQRNGNVQGSVPQRVSKVQGR